MPDIRVQDEQGTIHVFPDEATPEMIAKVMNVKPPSTSPAPSEQSTYQKLTAPIDPGAHNPVSRFFSSVGGAVIGAPEGVYNTLRHPIDAANSVKQSVGAYFDPSTRPTMQGAISVLPEALGQGVGGVAAGEVAGGIKSGVGAGVKKIVPSGVPEYLYRTALKPSTTIPVGKVNTIIQTGLEHGIPVHAEGLEKLGSLIDDLNAKIKNTIDAGNKQGVTVNKYDVASRLGDTMQKFKTQVNPTADLNAISESGNEFLANQPTNISASDAQALKQGTYQQLKSRSFGELKSAQVEAQKALARGLKEELARKFPEINDMNATESRLINLDGVLERAVNRIGNHQILGIGTPIAAGAAKAVTGSSGAAAVAGVLKGVFDNPYVKSRLAIALAKKGVSSGAASSRIASYSAGLGVAANAAQNDGQTGQ